MRLQNINWVKAEEYFKNNDTAILSVGSIESHGKHAALGTDFLIPCKILDLIEEKDDTLILPTLPFGNADFMTGYVGSISIGGDLLTETFVRIMKRLYEFGVRRFIILNGHGGNTSALQSACYEMDKMGCVSAILNWWSMVWDINPKWIGGHGGAEETSALLAISPDLVDKSLYEDDGRKNPTPNIHPTSLGGVEYKGVKFLMPRVSSKVVGSGWWGNDHPKEATEEWGKEMLQAIADYIVDFIGEFKKIEL